MTEQRARELLLIHSFAHASIEHPEMAAGFLGSLRPYTGLNESNFHEVMQALQVLAPQLAQEKLDRQLVNALWGLCHLSRAWGVHPDGMLRRNNLITAEDSLRLETWIETISYAVMVLLDGESKEPHRKRWGIGLQCQKRES